MKKMPMLLCAIRLLATSIFSIDTETKTKPLPFFVLLMQQNAAPDTIVYITKTGEKYHRDGCSYLSKSKIQIQLGAAVKKYTPCSRCKPPALD